jgi:hypothetical protein
MESEMRSRRSAVGRRLSAVRGRLSDSLTLPVCDASIRRSSYTLGDRIA